MLSILTFFFFFWSKTVTFFNNYGVTGYYLIVQVFDLLNTKKIKPYEGQRDLVDLDDIIQVFY